MEEQKAVSPEARWYVLHSYSGQEERVAASIRQRADAMNIGARVWEIIVPTREAITVRRGKKEEIKEKVLPGYILIKMVLDDESWLVVRTTPGVTSFVGTSSGSKPAPLSDSEAAAILKFSEQAAPKFKTQISAGQPIKIIDGPFADFLGTVQSVDDLRGKVKVLVSIFGRETPVELDFLQITKL